MTMYVGGEVVEHVRGLREDRSLVALFGDSVAILSNSVIEKWLVRMAA